MASPKCLNIMVVVVYLVSGVLMQSADYCKLCDDHIACNNDGKFSPSCSSDVKQVEMTQKRQQLILSLHNTQRNIVAKGEQQGFETASRMGLMQWDDELAKLAALNTKRCTFDHDKCRKTDRFDYAGQNIAITGESDKYPDVDASLKDLTMSWFSEQNVTSMEYINSYHDRSDDQAIGHFTQMVTDRASKIGCAVAQFVSEELGGMYALYYVCDYSVTNIEGVPVYKAGATASACKTGTDSKYNGLCSASEEYTALST